MWEVYRGLGYLTYWDFNEKIKLPLKYENTIEKYAFPLSLTFFLSETRHF